MPGPDHAEKGITGRPRPWAVKDKILIVEDNKKLADLFQEALSERFEPDVVHSVRDAHHSIGNGYSGYLLDLQLPDGEGISLISPIKKKRPDAVVIVVTAYGTVQKAVDALKLGAADFLEKPVDLEALLQRFCDLVPSSTSAVSPIAMAGSMKRVLELAGQVAPTPFPVLITGETGAGKEVLARYIHEQSGRAGIITLNCASLPEQLADSMLFGHTKGSFTGAVDSRKGLVEAADKGTLFLDEIGELPLSLQAKFLRFLDTGCFMPIGSTTEKKSSARIIAATNRNLIDSVAKGQFREDLYYRLATFPLELPPLRSRPEDIEPLCLFHLNKLKKVLGIEVRLSDEALEALKQYHFPGNVRELFNILDRASILAASNKKRPGVVSASLLRPLLIPRPDLSRTDEAREHAHASAGGGRSAAMQAGASDPSDFWAASRASAMEKERELIRQALEAAGYNKAAAARALKVSYKTLLNKMKKLGL